MRVPRGRALLRLACLPLSAMLLIGCVPTIVIPPWAGDASDDEEADETEELGGYVYDGTSLRFVIPSCYGDIISLTVQETEGVFDSRIWRSGAPRVPFSSQVNMGDPRFRVSYGEPGVQDLAITVLIDTGRDRQSVFDVPAAENRTRARPGYAVLPNGEQVPILEISGADDECDLEIK